MTAADTPLAQTGRYNHAAGQYRASGVSYIYFLASLRFCPAFMLHRSSFIITRTGPPLRPDFIDRQNRRHGPPSFFDSDDRFAIIAHSRDEIGELVAVGQGQAARVGAG